MRGEHSAAGTRSSNSLPVASGAEKGGKGNVSCSRFLPNGSSEATQHVQDPSCHRHDAGLGRKAEKPKRWTFATTDCTGLGKSAWQQHEWTIRSAAASTSTLLPHANILLWLTALMPVFRHLVITSFREPRTTPQKPHAHYQCSQAFRWSFRRQLQDKPPLFAPWPRFLFRSQSTSILQIEEYEVPLVNPRPSTKRQTWKTSRQWSGTTSCFSQSIAASCVCIQHASHLYASRMVNGKLQLSWRAHNLDGTANQLHKLLARSESRAQWVWCSWMGVACMLGLRSLT